LIRSHLTEVMQSYTWIVYCEDVEEEEEEEEFRVSDGPYMPSGQDAAEVMMNHMIKGKERTGNREYCILKVF
jgi:hypothetical protein